MKYWISPKRLQNILSRAFPMSGRKQTPNKKPQKKNDKSRGNQGKMVAHQGGKSSRQTQARLRNFVSGLSPLVKMFALPDEGPAFRLPAGGEPTCIVRPSRIHNFDFGHVNDSAYVTTGYNNGETGYWISNDPMHFFGYRLSVPKFRIYTWYFNYISPRDTRPLQLAPPEPLIPGGDPDLINVFSVPEIGSLTSNPSVPIPVRIPFAFCTADDPVITEALYSYQILGRSGIWLNGNVAPPSVVTFTRVESYDFVAGDEFQVYKLTGDSWDAYEIGRTGTGSSATTSVNINTNGIFAFEYVMSYNSSVRPIAYVSCKVAEVGDAMICEPLPGLSHRMSSLASVRINAASILVSNKSPAMYSGGELVGRHFPGTTMPTEMLGLDKVGSFRGAYTGNAMDGCYGFLRPAPGVFANMLNLFDYGNQYSLNITSMHNTSPFPTGGFTSIQMRIPAIAGAYPGALFSVRVTAIVETVNVGTWADADSCQLHASEVEDAVDLVAGIPCVYENPTHWKDVAMAVASKVGTGLKYSAKLINGLMTLGPAAAALYQGLAALA